MYWILVPLVMYLTYITYTNHLLRKENEELRRFYREAMNRLREESPENEQTQGQTTRPQSR